MQARGRFVEVDSPWNACRRCGPRRQRPLRPAHGRRAALGEHSEAILDEIGFGCGRDRKAARRRGLLAARNEDERNDRRSPSAAQRSPPLPPACSSTTYLPTSCAPRTCWWIGSARARRCEGPAGAGDRRRGAGHGRRARTGEALIHARAHLADAGRDGQRCVVALRRAGRRAQRCCVPSRDRGVPRRARRGAGRRCPRAASPNPRLVGYEVGIRVGEFLGRSHYLVFNTTGTAAALAAAAAAARASRLTPDLTLHAFGSAGTQAAGLWEFLRDGADSKQFLHAAGAAAAGLLAAWLARAGLTGARHILEGPQGMAAGMSSDADPGRLVDALGTSLGDRRDVVQVARVVPATRTPPADALLAVMREHGLAAEQIASVTAHVHQAALDVLGPVTEPDERCTSPSSRWAPCSRSSRASGTRAWRSSTARSSSRRPSRSASACGCCSTRKSTRPIRGAGSAR